jgi:hypothetical protein
MLLDGPRLARLYLHPYHGTIRLIAGLSFDDGREGYNLIRILEDYLPGERISRYSQAQAICVRLQRIPSDLKGTLKM